MASFAGFSRLLVSQSGRYCIKLKAASASARNCLIARGFQISGAVFGKGVLQDNEDPQNVDNAEWKKKLTSEQFYVCRQKGTEMPFTGKFVNHHEKGIYTCVCCGTELFSSDTKYDSGSGWPSFWEAYGAKGEDDTDSNVLRQQDDSHGMIRIEVMCKQCKSHLGHVFPDGPKPTHLRYCINSASLDFESTKASGDSKM